jgi:RNA polymerase sigma-70 factor (ECF subfamily)
MTSNQQDAEDVVQETFLRAFKRLDQFDDRAAFGTWLHRIAANCSIDIVRARMPRFEVVGAEEDAPDPMLRVPSNAPTPERAAVSSQIGDRVKDALSELSAQERTAFVLRHFEGMRMEEVGRVLGCGANSAKHSVFRAVHKLRRALEPLASAAR